MASPDRAWLHTPTVGAPDPFSHPMEGPASLPTTRKLLEGCIGLVQQAHRGAPPRPPLTRARWVWRLAGYYHSTHYTSRWMAEAARRFEEAGRTVLAEYCRLKEEDEAGHDILALSDLRAMGYPAEEVVAKLKPPTASRLLEKFRQCAFKDDPVEAVGYTYAAERLAISITEDYIRQVEEVVGTFNATRCLRVHSSIGVDVDHVEDCLECVVKLPASDRIRVAKTVYEVANIVFTVHPEDHLPEDDLIEMLAEFETPSPKPRSVPS